MTEWAEDLHASERIFIRASTHGKKSFWGYDEAVLDKNDERMRTFPFPTRRPVGFLYLASLTADSEDSARAASMLA